MDCKRNIAFFKQTDLVRIVGAALIIVGLLWFWLGYSALSYYLPCVMVPAGLVMFIVASVRNVSEGEIKEATQKVLAGLGDDVENSPDFSRKILTSPAPFRAEGPIYDEDAAYFRRGKNSTVISDVYVSTKLYFSRDRFLIRSRRVNLSTGATEDVSRDVMWDELSGAELVPFSGKVKLSNSKKTEATVHGVMLELKNADGQVTFRAPVHDDMEAVALCEAINKNCATAKPGN